MADNNEPMSDARLAEIRATLADEHGTGDITARLNSQWMSIRFSAQVAQAALDLLAEVERLRAHVAAMRRIVRVVAEADNSDSGVCYQLCNVRWYGGETDAENMEMRHDAPCIVEQARALFAPGESEA